MENQPTKSEATPATPNTWHRVTLVYSVTVDVEAPSRREAIQQARMEADLIADGYEIETHAEPIEDGTEGEAGR